MSVSGINDAEGLESTTILVVEDNPVERAVVERVLRDAGFEVCAVDSAAATAKALQHVRPDLILLDAMLPDRDGFAICRELKLARDTRRIPIVMLTGLGDVASIDRAYEAGATDFMSKPIGHALLIHRLRYLLRSAQAAEALRRSRRSFARAERIALLGHWELDPARERWFMSAELCRLYGLDPDGDHDGEALIDAAHPADRGALRRALEGAVERGQETRIEHRLHGDGGGERYVELHVAAVHDMAADTTLERGTSSKEVMPEVVEGRRPPHRVMGIALDVTERKQTEREVLRLAYFDRLTDLPNRALLETVLEQDIPLTHLRGGRVAVVGVDLDLFNRVNNAMGHSAGDALLRQVAVRLRRTLEAPVSENLLDRLSLTGDQVGGWPATLVARLGADVFAVIVAGADVCPDRALAIADRIRETLAQPFVHQGQEIFISAGMGVACTDHASCGADELLQRADLALREAKAAGHGEVREFHPRLIGQVSAQLAIQSDLRKALRQSEFQLHFQPKLGLVNDDVQDFEALIRWRHPERGLISPSQFIQLAEETGQIVEIGRWVLTAACQQFRQWLDQRLVTGRVSVNVSARQLRERHLMRTVLTALEQTGLPPSHLELEITEGVLMSDPRAIDVVAQLRAHGITIALDDFGTGFSSLSYLTRFPIDTVKIDRCFISEITPDSDKAAIVSAVTELSHRLQMTVVAEGVETDEELGVIRSLACDQVQGFRLSQPRSGHQIGEWLLDRRAAARALAQPQ